MPVLVLCKEHWKWNCSQSYECWQDYHKKTFEKFYDIYNKPSNALVELPPSGWDANGSPV